MPETFLVKPAKVTSISILNLTSENHLQFIHNQQFHLSEHKKAARSLLHFKNLFINIFSYHTSLYFSLYIKAFYLTNSVICAGSDIITAAPASTN